MDRAHHVTLLGNHGCEALPERVRVGHWGQTDDLRRTRDVQADWPLPRHGAEMDRDSSPPAPHEHRSHLAWQPALRGIGHVSRRDDRVHQQTRLIARNAKLIL